jgi:hypothetical protein
MRAFPHRSTNGTNRPIDACIDATRADSPLRVSIFTS